MSDLTGNKTFGEIYPNATLIDDDFLRNEYSYELYQLDAAEKKALFRNYYADMCAAVSALYFLHPSPAEIEAALERPGIRKEDLKTSVTDPDERRYLFRCATAAQLQYDLAKGNVGMQDENGRLDIAPGTLRILDNLGFVRLNYAMKG